VLCLDPLRSRRLANLALPISLWLDDGHMLPARRLALGKASRRAATKLLLLAFALLRLLRKGSNARLEQACALTTALTGLTIGILLLFSVAGLEACLLRGSGGGGGGIIRLSGGIDLVSAGIICRGRHLCRNTNPL